MRTLLSIIVVLAVIFAAACKNALAVPITYTFQLENVEARFFPLVSMSASFQLDSSVFTPPDTGDHVIFKTATNTNLLAFNVVFVTDVNGVNVTDTFNIPQVIVGSGAIFNSADNPPLYIDGSGHTAFDGTETLDFAGFFGGGGGAQISISGPYDEVVEGKFVASTAAVADQASTLVLGAIGFVCMILFASVIRVGERA